MARRSARSLMRMPLLQSARKLQTETQGAAPTAHQEIPKALVAGQPEVVKRIGVRVYFRLPGNPSRTSLDEVPHWLFLGHLRRVVLGSQTPMPLLLHPHSSE